MSSEKSLLLKSLKKTLAVGLPVMAVSGFVPTALTVTAAQAESKPEVVAEAKSEAEGKYGKAKSEAEAKAEGAKSEAEGKYGKAKSEAEGKYGKAKSEAEAKAEGAKSEAKSEAEAEAKKY